MVTYSNSLLPRIQVIVHEKRLIKKALACSFLILAQGSFAVNGLDTDEYMRCGEVDEMAFGSLFFLNANTGRAYQHHLWRDPAALGGMEALLGQEYGSFDPFFEYMTTDALNYSFMANPAEINIGYLADPDDEFYNPLKVNYQIDRTSGQYLWTSAAPEFAGEEDRGSCESVTPGFYRDMLEDWYKLANEQEPEKLFEL